MEADDYDITIKHTGLIGSHEMTSYDPEPWNSVKKYQKGDIVIDQTIVYYSIMTDNTEALSNSNAWIPLIQNVPRRWIAGKLRNNQTLLNNNTDLHQMPMERISGTNSQDFHPDGNYRIPADGIYELCGQMQCRYTRPDGGTMRLQVLLHRNSEPDGFAQVTYDSVTELASTTETYYEVLTINYVGFFGAGYSIGLYMKWLSTTPACSLDIFGDDNSKIYSTNLFITQLF